MRRFGLGMVKHRVTMERIGQLEPRISVLEDDFDEDALEAEAGNAQAAAVSVWHFPHSISKHAAFC